MMIQASQKVHCSVHCYNPYVKKILWKKCFRTGDMGTNSSKKKLLEEEKKIIYLTERKLTK